MPRITKSHIQTALARGGVASSDFDLNPDAPLSDIGLRDAAVLVAFLDTAQGPHIVFTKRARHLKHHPGQV